MQKMGDDPPFLVVGTEVSAKYKGAFCEAKIRKVVKNIKCKVLFKGSNQSLILSDEHIRGTLRVGAQVEARHPEKNQFLESIVSKIQDCSQYTVVFDDGDITTLRRSALCLKSGRHFAESETLDQLPLTHPEHFGTPVVGGRRGRRSLQTQEDSSEEDEDSVESGRQDRLVLVGSGEREPDIGKVVIVEVSDKKKGKEPWFPGLVVSPTAQDAVTIRVKDEYLVRSFRDGRYYTVPKKEASDFTREASAKTDNAALKVAVEKALLYMDREELPPHWDRDVLFGLDDTSSVDDSKADSDAVSSDEETREAKDHFVARLYKFMDDRGTPINKCPTIMNRDLDLYRLYKVVTKLGGFNRVNNQNAWKIVVQKMLLSGSTAVNHIKQAYKKYLQSFEDFYRKLGCTMHSPSQPSRPRGNRSLLREKDRTASGSSTPKRETDAEAEEKPETPAAPVVVAEEESKRKNSSRLKKAEEAEDSGDDSEISGRSQRQGRGKRASEDEPPEGKGKKRNKVKEEGENELTKIKIKEEASAAAVVVKEEGDRRMKMATTTTPKEQRGAKLKKIGDDSKSGEEGQKSAKKEETPPVKKRGRKPKALTESEEADGCRLPVYVDIQIGDKLRVYYGPNHEMKVTYEAKVNEIRQEGSQKLFLVHYTGWNTRYDEWIKRTRVAENLSWTPGRRRSHGTSPALSKSTPSRPGPVPGKRGKPRTHQDTSRSTTPSSVASSSSIGPRNAQATPSANESEPGGGTSDGRRRSRRISEMSGVTDADSENSSEDEESPPPPPEEEVIPAKKKRGRKKKSESSCSAAGDSETPSAEHLEVRSATRRGRRKRAEEELAPPTDAPPEANQEKATVEDVNASGSEVEQTKAEEPKGKHFDLKKIRSELKMPADMTSTVPPPPSSPSPTEESSEAVDPTETTPAANQSEDVYEFREPEPFEFEIRERSRKAVREAEDPPADPTKEKETPPADPEPQEPADPVPEPRPEPTEKIPPRPPVIVPAFVPQVMPALSTLARSMVPIQVKGQELEVVEKVIVKEEPVPAIVEVQKSPVREIPPEEPAPDPEVEQVEVKVEEEEAERELETVVEETPVDVPPEEEEEEPEEAEQLKNRRNSSDSATPRVKPEEEYEMSSLLCEETIPGSPVTHSCFAVDPSDGAPMASTSRSAAASSSAEEIPFASAPAATSALRGMRDPRPARKRGLREALALQQQANGGGLVMDNTPPTTPEDSHSPASNSPEGGMSPDHESSNGSSIAGDGSKKSEADGGSEKASENLRNLNSGPRASATLLPSATLATKRREEEGKDEESPLKRKRRVPDNSVSKRGRAYGRSPRRTGSDSEDLVENAALSLNSLQYSHPTRPSRYNFCMELDPELDATQRIAVLQEKMRQLRETYMALKSQVAVLDRRKKKLKRKEREEKSSREVTAS